MNVSKSRFDKSIVIALAVVTTVLLVSGGASARERKAKGLDNQAHVVAHLSFSGLSAVDMAMQRTVDDKHYIYVQHSKDQGISVIDISKPAQPKAVGVIPWPDRTMPSRMNVTGDLAFIAQDEILPTHTSLAGGSLVLWDLSNPAAPRVVQRFSGVVKWLQDERNFTYVLNAEGLWVISEPVDRQPEQTGPSLPYGD